MGPGTIVNEAFPLRAIFSFDRLKRVVRRYTTITLGAPETQAGSFGWPLVFDDVNSVNLWQCTWYRD